MNNFGKYITFSSFCSILLCSTFPVTGYADTNKIKLKSSVKAQYTYNNNDDLDTLNADTRTAETIEGKATVYGNLNQNFSFLAEARAVKNYGDGGSIDSDTGEASGDEDFVELRQYWIEYGGFSKTLPISVRAGRQRIREDYSLWWNRDLDAISLKYDATLFSGFLTVGQNLTEYRSTGDVFNKDEEEKLRILGQTSLQWKKGNFIETRIAYQKDHSGIDTIGSIVSSNDWDDEDADLFWVGVRAVGKVDLPMSKQIDALTYRADVITLTGNQDTIVSSDNGDGTRTITGNTQQDVSGWAVDLAVEASLPIWKKPTISIGYAYGSGDDDLTDSEDSNFRQTGLDGNTSRMLGSKGSYYNYGSVLRPDLANIHILTAGINMPVMNHSDLGFVYHYYRLAEDATSLSTSGITADLNGSDKYLGQGVDMTLNTDISKEFGITHTALNKVGIKTTLGMFKAGDAYGTAEDEIAYRGQINLSFRF